MDKYEYKVRSEEISNLIEKEQYAEAVNIADTIDWRRVKSSTMLLKIAALYRVNKRNEDSREILLLAYDRYPTNRSVVYSLCELSIELDDVVAAIEYYKQFVRLAPKDSGVFTLRYRILEAQEASLEERIEILEELKIKDYQEEWVYELAYLYHRVGLATKCVETCDELILFIGDGPYVMKAMELKALHVPLTELQQEKYNHMLGNANGNYSADDYADGEYSEENYDGQYYGDENYQDENYQNENYDEVNYSDENYQNENYDGVNYGDENYADGNYSDENYQNENYDGVNYGDENYADGNYSDENYQNENYDGQYYGEEAYPEEGYGNQEYYSEEYPQDSYENDEYYAEQTYDDNSDPVNNESHEAAASQSVDMSQYNTINLQKVVAESMKELFPDDDVFAEDREKFNSDVEQEDLTGDTLVYGINAPDEDADISSELEQEPDNGLHTYTGRVAQMVTGISEEAPQPNTGSISKVIVPGEDALFIQSDSSLDELRDTTEQSVEDEHIRMENNSENVYHDQSILDMDSENSGTGFIPMTGQISLDEALAEWENMKLDNAKKRQEQIKEKVKSQTGKIFADFDNSVNSGILGELEKDEKPSGNKAADLQPDMAIGEKEDDFDVTYNSESAQEAGPDPRQEYLSELERVVANELGGTTEDIPQTELDEAVQEADTVQYDDAADYPQEEYDEEGYSEAEYYEENENTADMENYSDSENNEDLEYYDENDYLEADNYVSDSEPAQSEYKEKELDPEEAESIAEMAKEDALKTQEIKLNTADLSSLSEKIVAVTKKEATGAKREEVRDFTPDEQTLFENFAVTKKIKKQIIYAIDNMSLAAYTGNVIITGDAGLDTVRMAKNLIKEYQAQDNNFSGKIGKITGEKINQRNLKDVFEKLNNGGIIIEKANGMTEEKLYEMASLLNQENLGIVVIIEDTKKEITKLLEKQAMIADYFNIRVDLMEMDNNALVAYAKNYALALEYSIDELGTLALYTRIANMQSGNHVVTKDEVREIIDEAIYKSKKSKIKNFVDVLFARRYDEEDMIVLKERDFM